MPKDTSEIRSCPDQNGRPDMPSSSGARTGGHRWVMPGYRSPRSFDVGAMRQVVSRAAWRMVRGRAARGSGMGGLTHPTGHDSQTQIRRVSVVFEEEGRLHRQAAHPWDICNAGEGEETRARRSVFQEALAGRHSLCTTRPEAEALNFMRLFLYGDGPPVDRAGGSARSWRRRA